MASAGTLLFQCLHWLRYGQWWSAQVRMAWRWIGGGEPGFPNLRGMEKILRWCLELPLDVGLFIVGVFLVLAGFWLVEGLKSRTLGL